jgi:hypothetical protein
MAKTGTFTATTSWQAVQLDGEDITDGTYSIFSKTSKRVGTIIGTVLPTASNGDIWLEEDKRTQKFDLAFGDKWYVKSDTSDVNITVIKS